jgi:hypothetical protein
MVCIHGPLTSSKNSDPSMSVCEVPPSAYGTVESCLLRLHKKTQVYICSLCFTLARLCDLGGYIMMEDDQTLSFMCQECYDLQCVEYPEIERLRKDAKSEALRSGTPTKSMATTTTRCDSMAREDRKCQHCEQRKSMFRKLNAINGYGLLSKTQHSVIPMDKTKNFEENCVLYASIYEEAKSAYKSVSPSQSEDSLNSLATVGVGTRKKGKSTSDLLGVKKWNFGIFNK